MPFFLFSKVFSWNEFFLFDFLGNSDQVEEKIRDCGERLYNANSKIGSAIFVANRDL